MPRAIGRADATYGGIPDVIARSRLDHEHAPAGWNRKREPAILGRGAADAPPAGERIRGNVLEVGISLERDVRDEPSDGPARGLVLDLTAGKDASGEIDVCRDEPEGRLLRGDRNLSRKVGLALGRK